MNELSTFEYTAHTFLLSYLANEMLLQFKKSSQIEFSSSNIHFGQTTLNVHLLTCYFIIYRLTDNFVVRSWTYFAICLSYAAVELGHIVSLFIVSKGCKQLRARSKSCLSINVSREHSACSAISFHFAAIVLFNQSKVDYPPLVAFTHPLEVLLFANVKCRITASNLITLVGVYGDISVFLILMNVDHV